MNPLRIAAMGKGPFNALNRLRVITSRYGLTPAKMERILDRFSAQLDRFGCQATFPIPASALGRSDGLIERHQARGVEFAIHGYYHIDHTQLSLEEQLSHFERARQVFEKKGVACHGFRSPYLRWNEATLAALARCGFLYEGSHALAWDVLDSQGNAAYQRVLDFYGASAAREYPSLPRMEKGLVRIPYCLPDDEALIDRFHLKPGPAMHLPWLAILDKTHALGELFTLGLHPERIDLCAESLAATLQRARALSPAVWIARLDQIARWWIERSEAARNAILAGSDEITLRVKGPPGTTILARRLVTVPSGVAWDGSYQRLPGDEITFRCDRRPFIGVSPRSSPELLTFLHQQGYLAEIAGSGGAHSLFLDLPNFHRELERPLLAHIEEGDFPLLRLGRWPAGARSALCVTGDIDALTIWDYGLRFIGQ